MDRGVWWSVVYRIAQSQTRLKRFSMQAQAGSEYTAVGRGDAADDSCQMLKFI